MRRMLFKKCWYVFILISSVYAKKHIGKIINLMSISTAVSKGVNSCVHVESMQTSGITA